MSGSGWRRLPDDPAALEAALREETERAIAELRETLPMWLRDEFPDLTEGQIRRSVARAEQLARSHFDAQARAIARKAVH